MMFEEFRETEEFMSADVVTFLETNGEELDIDNLYGDDLNRFYVESWHNDNGRLQIVIRKEI